MSAHLTFQSAVPDIDAIISKQESGCYTGSEAIEKISELLSGIDLDALSKGTRGRLFYSGNCPDCFYYSERAEGALSEVRDLEKIVSQQEEKLKSDGQSEVAQ